MSKAAESLPPGWTMGRRLCMSGPNSGQARLASTARIRLMLPRRVLISPLWATMRKGWASFQLGKVLVLYR